MYKCVRRERGITSYCAIKVITVPHDSSELDSLRLEGYTDETSREYFNDIVDSFANEIGVMESLKGFPNIVSVEDFRIVEENAFEDLFNLQTVEIKGNLTAIGDYAFSNCRALSRINLPDSLEEIGESAFTNCTNLNEVHLSESLSKIGDFAFKGSGLNKIYIPRAVKTLSQGLFEDCASLNSVSGMQNVAYVEPDVFKSSGVEELVFSEEIFVVQDAFENCNHLKKIVIPTDIAKFTVNLTGCPSLTDMYLPLQIDEVRCVTDRSNSIVVHARRGSNWRQQISVFSVDYLKNADYDEQIRIELAKSGLLQKSFVSESSQFIETKDSARTVRTKSASKRAAWNTKSLSASEDQFFASGPATVDELLDKLQITDSENQYTVETHDCSVVGIDYVEQSVRSNLFVRDESRKITNNLFTVELNHNAEAFPSLFFATLVNSKGVLVSDAKRVVVKHSSCDTVSIHFQLNAGVSNGKYYLLISSKEIFENCSIISSDECLVDISFSVDLDFGF